MKMEGEKFVLIFSKLKYMVFFLRNNTREQKTGGNVYKYKCNLFLWAYEAEAVFSK